MYIKPKIIVKRVYESLESIPINIQLIKMTCVGINKNKYLTRDQMIHKSEKAISALIYTVDCDSNCKLVHENLYAISNKFDSL